MLHLQLPSHIHHLFKAYRVLSQTRYSLQKDENVSAYIRNTSDAQLDLILRQFMNRSKVRHQHLPPRTPRIVQDMLSNWIPLSPLEGLLTLEFFKPLAVDTSQTSESSLYAPTFTKFESAILCRLQAISNPHQTLPKTRIATKQFLWYSKLLKETPVVIFLAKREHLFSDESLHQIDISRTAMEARVQELSNAMSNRLGSHRTYHFTDLTSTDIFTLAVDKQELFANAEPEQYPEIIEKLHGGTVDKQDVLCQHLGQEHIKFQGRNKREIPEVQMKDILEKTSLNEDIIGIHRDPDCFQYDMHYTSHYMMTIEKEILTESHDELMDLIESSSFTVVGARLSLKHNAIADFIQQEQFSSHAKPRHNYDELIAQATEKHPDMAPKKHISDLFKRFAGLGLVKVVPQNESLYLVGAPSTDPCQ